MSHKRQGRELPPRFRHVITTNYFRTFTFKERLGLLFGCGFLVKISVWCVNRPGRFDPVFASSVVREMTAEDRAAAEIRESLQVDRASLPPDINQPAQ